MKPEEGKEEEKKEGEEEVYAWAYSLYFNVQNLFSIITHSHKFYFQKKPEGEAAPAGEGAPAPAAEGEAPAAPAEGEAAPAAEEPAAE